MFAKTLLSFAGLSALASAMPAIPVGGVSSIPHPDIAAIMAQPQSNFTSHQTGGLIRSAAITNSTLGKRDCASTPIFTWGDSDNGGIGVTITNADTDWRGFYFYHNGCDSVPYKYVWINAGQTEFVSLPYMFEGRVTRGTDQWNLGGVPRTLGSWFEITLDSSNVMWADVSLIRGCDGSVLCWGLDSAQAWKGFTQWILDGAPGNSYDEKPSGNWVLRATEDAQGNVFQDPVNWEMQQVGAQYVYVDDHHGNPVVSSSNGRFGTYWPAGRL